MTQPTTAPDPASTALAAPSKPLSPDMMIKAAAAIVQSQSRDQFDLTFTRSAPGVSPDLTLTAGERRVTISVKELRNRLAHAHAPAHLDPAVQVIAEWVDKRPVNDDEALKVGVATLMWAAAAAPRGRALSDPGSDLRWQVVSSGRTAAQPMPWLPSPTTPRGRTPLVRKSALANATTLPVTAITAGDVVVWTHAPHPALSSAVLCDISHAAAVSGDRLGLDSADLWMVAAPGRPVAVAGQAAAKRLSQETTAAHVCCPLSSAMQIGW